MQKTHMLTLIVLVSWVAGFGMIIFAGIVREPLFIPLGLVLNLTACLVNVLPGAIAEQLAQTLGTEEKDELEGP